MPSTLSTLLRVALCALTLSPLAAAGDYYVDRNAGNNSNDGLTPGTPWRNISFALASVPATSTTGVHTIHVAPGDYSAGAGESFPLSADTDATSGDASIELVSDAGSGATTITPNVAVAMDISFYEGLGGGGLFTSRITRVEGFRIAAMTHGISMSFEFGVLSAAFHDVVIEGGTGDGFKLSNGFSQGGGGALTANLSDCEVRNMGGSAVRVETFVGVLPEDTITVHMTGTTLRDCGTSGLSLEPEDDFVIVDMDGCTVVGNGLYGVNTVDFGSGGGGMTLSLSNTIVADNGQGGIFLAAAAPGPDLGLVRCTVANNSGPGVRAFNANATLDCDTSILFGNAPDVTGSFGTFAVEYTDQGTGPVSGSSTNLSTDPLFVDGAGGDYRLQAGSPCIDQGNPALAPDADGTVADMGALPFDQDATSTYCTGKTSSLSCVPFLSWTGFASVSAPQPFQIRAEDVLPSELGVLVYGYKAGNLSFHGGKLCVKPPLQRVLPAKLAKSTGAPPCSGVLTRNFNARIQSETDPLLSVGATAYAQWRTRDPLDPAGFGDGLTDGLRFEIAP